MFKREIVIFKCNDGGEALMSAQDINRVKQIQTLKKDGTVLITSHDRTMTVIYQQKKRLRRVVRERRGRCGG